MSHKLKGVCVGAMLLLAACGAPAADQAASTAASAANQAASALPSVDSSAAASAANQAASVAASAASAAASALPSDAASAVNQAASAAASALAGVTPSNLAGIVPQNLALQSSEPLVLDVTEQAGVANYRWTIVQSPPGAESVQGTTIEENSNGKLTINPTDYAQYFPASGNYVINLELTNTNGTVNTVPIPLIVP